MKSSAHDRSARPSRRSLWALGGLNFFLADVQTGIGPFLAIYLAGLKWNEQSIGVALTLGSLASIAFQTPAGAWIDRTLRKRLVMALGVIALAVGTIILAYWPALVPVMAAQIIIGSASSIFGPGIAAISLGIVGRKLFDRQTGLNQMLNSAGNVTTALSVGLLAFYFNNRSMFLFVLAMCVPTLLAIFLINGQEIDNSVARGGSPQKKKIKTSKVIGLMANRPLIIFCVAAVLFHFANAAMLPLLGEMLAKGHGKESAFFMSMCIVVAQLTMVGVAMLAGKFAGQIGRKPLLIVGFLALPIRGFLYTMVKGAAPLVSIQVLDGIGAGIFGVVSVLVIADLTNGTGRFNLAFGAVATAVGIGASLSQVIAGSIVHHFNYTAAFLFLSAVAIAGFLLILFFMPETLAKNHPKHL